MANEVSLTRRNGQAAAGATAAAAWGTSEPVARRVFRTSHSVRLLGIAVTRCRAWPVAGLVLHIANGALFGIVLGRLSHCGWRGRVIAAEIENLAMWPAIAIVDRVHLDQTSGARPPVSTNARAFVQEVATHALFGAILDAFLARSSSDPSR